jgi:hypothetical protein
MGFFTEFMQGIPANSALRERVLLAEDKLQALEVEAQQLRDQVSALKVENAELQKRLTEKLVEETFERARGALWKKESDGQYLPYCPKCRLPFSSQPSYHPEFFICTVCKYEPSFTPDHVPEIVASFAHASEPEKTFRDYTCDSFFGLMWRWNYDAKGKINRIRPFCPQCDRELSSRNNDMWANEDFSLVCSAHGTIRGKIRSINEFEGDAVHEAELNIRNAQWREKVA